MSCVIFVLGFGLGTAVFIPIVNITYGNIVSEINNSNYIGHKMRDGDRTKTLYALRLHAKLFPESGTRSRMVICGVLGILAFVIFVTSLVKCFGSVG